MRIERKFKKKKGTLDRSRNFLEKFFGTQKEKDGTKRGATRVNRWYIVLTCFSR